LTALLIFDLSITRTFSLFYRFSVLYVLYIASTAANNTAFTVKHRLKN